MTNILYLEPYLGLEPYQRKDAIFFFGREKWQQKISDCLEINKLTVLYGESGVGKSSLLQAGIVNRWSLVAEENLKNDIIVVNDVEIKMNSSDDADLILQDSQKTAISQLIDNFKQQVSQIADFNPGITMTPDQIRFDGTLTDQDISFVFIAGKDAGIYINAEMLKLEQDVANMLEKLVKFQETFQTSMDPLIKERNYN
jgi:hypothetical protein